MNKYILIKLIALAFAGFLNTAQASTLLSIKLPGDALNYTTTVGSLFDAKIYANALPDLALFDFYLTFDSTKLKALSLTSAYVFGSDGTEANPNSTTSPTVIYGNSLTSPGLYHFGETISGTSPTALTAGLNITAPTLLGTIHFQTLATGANSSLSFSTNVNTPLILGDFAGNSVIQPGDTFQPASVSITPSAVPLPASALLFAPGLLAVFGLRKKQAEIVAL